MEEKSGKEFLKLLGASGTWQIIEFIGQHGRAQYSQMRKFLNTNTLNTRLRQLLIFDLVCHHMERVETRKEWYELTEKGKKVLLLLQDLVSIIKESP